MKKIIQTNKSNITCVDEYISSMIKLFEIKKLWAN